MNFFQVHSEIGQSKLGIKVDVLNLNAFSRLSIFHGTFLNFLMSSFEPIIDLWQIFHWKCLLSDNQTHDHRFRKDKDPNLWIIFLIHDNQFFEIVVKSGDRRRHVKNDFEHASKSWFMHHEQSVLRFLNLRKHNLILQSFCSFSG